MSNPSRQQDTKTLNSRRGERANARLVVLVAVAFLLGAGGAIFWLRARHPASVTPVSQPGASVTLSTATRDVLQHLDSTVQIRYYDLLDPASVPASTQAFARRVDQLLSEYQREAGGKIQLTRYDSAATLDAAQAAADGIEEFNVEKGAPCYFGVAVIQAQRKQSLPRLSPEWEPALEADLTRAIVRVTARSPSTSPGVASAKLDPATTEEVKQLIPNLNAVSVEEGTRIIREHALQEFKTAAAQMQTQVQQAEQQLTQAQTSGSAADQQAAMKNLQQLQADQAEKLKQIAAQSHAQIEALKQMKQAGR